MILPMGAETPRATSTVGASPLADTTPAGLDSGAEAVADDVDPSKRFAVGDEVARGGMGRVVTARDGRLGREVAIKEALHTDDPSVRRFEREVQITARLQHPAIVPLYDAGRWPSGVPYYVMRLLSGRPLSEHIERAASLDARLALVPSFLAAADAVGYAHREGIIHRDLKPANVLLGEHGETMVIDWGLAKVVGEAEDAPPHAAASDDAATGATLRQDSAPDETRIGSVLGTPGYMAPEQAAGDPADARSDVYALGATLYHLLAGAPPHLAASATVAMDRGTEGSPPLSRRAPGTPPELLAIVDKSMAAEPAQRYSDASELAADLRRFLTGQLVAAHRYSPGDRVRRLLRRHRAAFAVGALAAGVLLVTVSIGLGRIVAAKQRAESARADAVRGWRSAEQARRRAQDRADDLLLARAQGMLESDPTAAAAQVDRLPLESSHWPRARALLSAAASRGIARSLPGKRDAIVTLAPDPTGRRLLSMDRSGQVEIHDLDRWRSTVIARAAGDQNPSAAVWAEGGRAVVIARGAAVVLIDVAGRQRTIARAASRISDLVGPDDASFLVWNDDQGRSSQAAAPDWKPTPLRVGEPGTSLQLSRDGRWLATSGQREPLRLWRRGGRQPVVTGASDCLASFHPRLARAALFCKGEVTEWDLARAAVRMRWPAPTPMALPAYGGDGLYLLTGSGEVIALWPRGSTETLADGTHVSRFPTALPGGFAVSSDAESLLLIDGAWTHTMRMPGSAVMQMAALRGGSQLAAGSISGRILVFDLEAVRPRQLEAPVSASRILALTSRSAVLSLASGEIQRIDLDSGASSKLGEVLGTAERSRATPDGSAVLALTMMGELAATRPADGAFEQLAPGGVQVAEFSGPGRAVWYRDGALWEKTLFSDQPARRAAAWEAGLLGMAAHSGWLAGSLDDGTLWRRAPGSSSIASIGTGRVLGPLAVAPDGTVYASVGREVLRWRRGAAERFVTLPDRVLELALDPAVGLSATTADGAVQLVPLAGGAIRTTRLPAPVFPIDLSTRGARAAARNRAGQPLAVDLAGGVVHALAPINALHVVASGDGNTGALAPGRLYVFGHDLPRQPTALRAWLGRVTNASIDDSGQVSWP
jgi:eukaryotic-like serine/threonine-protein kinase